MGDFIKKYFRPIRKIKILDWVVVTIIFGLIIFLIVLTLNRSRWITIEFKIVQNPTYFSFSNPETTPYWVAENVRPGDVQYNNLGQKNLQVLNVTSWGFNYRQTWVKASVNVKYNPTEKKYSFQYQPLEIGRPIDVSLNGTSIHGIVTAIQGFTDQRPLYNITIKARLVDTNTPYSVATLGVDPWIADAVDEGQIMTDESGRQVAKIVNKDVTPAERVITTSDGRVLTGEDPLKKDVYLTIQLSVTRTNNTYFFMEDTPIKIGLSFPLFLKHELLYPLVTQIQD